MASGFLFVLYGMSGSGKTTILRYLQRTIGIDAAPKFTTRASRGTADDHRDFLFCSDSDFPTNGILEFESYGARFGIQLTEIAKSLTASRSHALIVGNTDVVRHLRNVFPEQVVCVLVFCDATELERRVLLDPSRVSRWSAVKGEIATIYGQLGGVDFVVDNGGAEQDTYRQMEILLSRLQMT